MGWYGEGEGCIINDILLADDGVKYLSGKCSRDSSRSIMCWCPYELWKNGMVAVKALSMKRSSRVAEGNKYGGADEETSLRSAPWGNEATR